MNLSSVSFGSQYTVPQTSQPSPKNSPVVDLATHKAMVDTVAFSPVPTIDELKQKARAVGSAMTGFNPNTASMAEAKKVGDKAGEASRQLGNSFEKFAQANKLNQEQQKELFGELQKEIITAGMKAMEIKKPQNIKNT